MQRVYQFHHFGKGAETYRRPWVKATLLRACAAALCRREQRSYSWFGRVSTDRVSATGLRQRREQMAQTDKQDDRQIVARNKRARHDYHILDSWEAGLVLTGT